MQAEILVAIIGALGTLLSGVPASLLGIKREKQESVAANRPPRYFAEATIIGLAILVAAGLVLFGIHLAQTAREAESQSPNLEALIAEARRAGKPYYIESIAQMVRLADTYSPQANSRVSSVRTIYVLRPLRKLNKSEALFNELYTSSHVSRPPEHWYGSQREIFANDNGSRYDVQIEANANDTYTVITGANFYYDLPFTSDRMVPAAVRSLSRNEDYWIYPNEDDFVGQITISIESPTTRMQALQRGKLRITNKQPLLDDVTTYAPTDAQPAQQSLTASWSTVRPREKVGILYSWADHK